MSLSKQIFTITAPIAMLTVAGCSTGLSTKVSRFNAMPAPAGQSFTIQPVNASQQGSLEFSQYAGLVARYLAGQGYAQAASPSSATLVVNFNYGVDKGQTKIVTTPGTGPWAGPWYGPYYSRFGYFGYRPSPFYWGWDNPFWYGGPEVTSYTEYTSFFDMEIKRASDGQAVFEGIARARSTSNDLPVLVPNLIEAMFTNFPGRSGETVRITVPPAKNQ